MSLIELIKAKRIYVIEDAYTARDSKVVLFVLGRIT